MTSERSQVAQPAHPGDAVVARYRHRARLGERVRWLPPYRLVPSFASADGQTVVYRRRSQVVLSDQSENSAIAAPTSFALGATEMKVRIDQYGYARMMRPARSQQHIDPLTQLTDSAADLEHDAALAVCRHLNEHVQAIGAPHRFIPPPSVQLVPLPSRVFAELAPEPPLVAPGRAAPSKAVNDYLDARAAWLKRRFAWDNARRAVNERAARAAAGDPVAMHEHLVACLQDVLWPAPTEVSFSFVGADEVLLDIRLPEREALPDREAVVTYGNRVAVRPMLEVRRDLLLNGHTLGLVLRLLGEAFAALPTVRRATASAFDVPRGKGPRYLVSAATERRIWTAVYAEKWFSEEPPARGLKALEARYRVTGLGAFLPIEPLR